MSKRIRKKPARRVYTRVFTHTPTQSRGPTELATSLTHQDILHHNETWTLNKSNCPHACGPGTHSARGYRVLPQLNETHCNTLKDGTAVIALAATHHNTRNVLFGSLIKHITYSNAWRIWMNDMSHQWVCHVALTQTCVHLSTCQCIYTHTYVVRVRVQCVQCVHVCVHLDIVELRIIESNN